MKNRIFGALLISLSLAAIVRGEDAKDAPKDDRKIVQGTWLPVSAELAGTKWGDEILKTMKLTLKDERYVVKVGENTDKGTYTLDAKKKVKEMDIKGTEGPNKDKTFLTIYELKDDTLKVCYDLGGKNRPTEFKTKENTQLFLVTYKREKP